MCEDLRLSDNEDENDGIDVDRLPSGAARFISTQDADYTEIHVSREEMLKLKKWVNSNV